MLSEYEEDIYRPGEELPDNLTEEEWDEREIEIRKLFEQAENGK